MKKKNLINKITFIDGYSATGKGIFCHFIETFNFSSKMHVDHIFSEIAILDFLGKIDREYASFFLKMRADNYLENEFLSRDLNFRPFDDSSIFKTGNAIKYFKRLFSKDGDAIFENSDLKKTNLIVMNHFSSHNSNFFFKTFKNKMNYINIVRHPIHIFDHWVYLFTSLKNNNPRVKNFLIDNQNDLYFWFEGPKASEYDKIYDRIINSMLYLDFLNKSNRPNFENYLQISFEDFYMYTNSLIEKLEDKFNFTPTKYTFNFIKKFNLNTKKFMNRKQKRKNLSWKATYNVKTALEDHFETLSKIQANSSPPLYKKFLTLCTDYEKQHNLEFLDTIAKN